MSLRTRLIASEITLLERLHSGMSLKQIAGRDGKALQSVSQRMRRILKITGCSNHFQLGIWARDNGYAEPLFPKVGEVRTSNVEQREMVAGQP